MVTGSDFFKDVKLLSSPIAMETSGGRAGEPSDSDAFLQPGNHNIITKVIAIKGYIVTFFNLRSS